MARKNWKLEEIEGSYKVINDNAMDFISNTLLKINYPIKINPHISRSESFVDWGKISLHNNFFFDYVGNEDVKDFLKKSYLGSYNEIIITYCQENIVVSIKSDVFFEEWEEIFASTFYNALFFSPDYRLIMEITRDYYLHSNFKIFDKY